MPPVTLMTPGMTRPQRQLRHRVDTLAARVVESARRSRHARREAEAADTRMTALDTRHPHYRDADLSARLAYWLGVGALAAAVGLDAVLSAPVAEHLLLTYVHASAGWATVGRFLCPALLVAVELALGIAMRQAWEAGERGRAAALAAAGLVPVVVLPILVGETEHTRALVLQAEATGQPVAAGGLFQNLSLFIAAMMLLAFFVHAFVVFGPHEETLSYLAWSIRHSSLDARKVRTTEAARQWASQAGDAFAAYVAARDEYVRQYPAAPLPVPHWAEAREVLREQYGYDVIVTPTGPPATSAAGGTPSPAVPPPPPTPGPTEAAGSEPESLEALLRERIRESEAAVTL